MKRIMLIIFLVLGAAVAAPAQQYFNIRDALHGVGTIMTSVVERNSKYYVTGFGIDSSHYIGNDQFANVSGIRFAVYDSTGNKLIDTMYEKMYMQALQAFSTSSLYAMPDGNFVVAGWYQDTNKWNAAVVKFDSVGHKLWEKIYAQPLCPENEWYKVTDFKPTPYGEWLLLADVYCDIGGGNKRNTIALTKLNSNFNVLWTKQYGDATLNEYPGKILVEPNGYVIGGCRNNENLVQINFSFRAELIGLDTGGNQQWNYLSDPTNLTNTPHEIIKTSDGGYVYCGSGNGVERPDMSHTFAQLDFKDWVEKIDASHNHVWGNSYNTYYYTELKAIKEISTGNLLLFGDKYCPVILDSTTLGGNAHTKGWFLKVKSNGDSISEHTYYGIYTCNDNNSFNDVKQTSDGGFVMVGGSLDQCHGFQNPAQRGWIVKVDSNGCVDPVFCDQQDTATGVQVIVAKNKELKLYPNPSNGSFTISSPISGLVNIMSIDGRNVLQTNVPKGETQVQMPRGCSAGMYIVQCRDEHSGEQLNVVRFMYEP